MRKPSAKASVIDVSIVHYPESDGRPMGETDIHRDAMFRHIELLRHYYEGQQVYVSGNLLVYYEQGNPRKFVVPDAFVVQGVDPGQRRVYKTWVEGKALDVAIETTSRKTKRQDTVLKPDLYARLGISEYFLFDPTSEYLDPPLQGYRLVGGAYEPIDADAQGALVSQVLGRRLRIEKGKLAFYRFDNDEPLLTDAERAAREVAARQAAEAEAARLREKLRKRPGV